MKITRYFFKIAILSLSIIFSGVLSITPIHAANGINESCTTNNECTSGLCINSVCKLKMGSACTGNSQCGSDDCEDSFCDCSDSYPSKQCAAEYGLTSNLDVEAQKWTCESESKDPDKSRAFLDFCVNKSFTATYPLNSIPGQVIYPLEQRKYMGEPCNESENCLSSAPSSAVGEKCNSTKLISTLENDPWFSSGRMLKVCTADFDEEASETIKEVCTRQYGSGTWTVTKVTDVGSQLEGLRVCKNTNTTWQPTTLEEMKKHVAPTSSNNPDGSTKTEIFGFDATIPNIELVQPAPKIKVPGVIFSKISKESSITTDEAGASWLNVPFLGEYIAAIYKYSVGLISLVAVMVLILSGVQIVTSAGNSEAITSAKHRIVSSVIAIILTAGSYTILYTINPDLVNLKNLKIVVVPGKTIDIPENEGAANLNLDTPEGDAAVTQAATASGAAPVSGEKYVCGNTGSIEQKRENCKQWCLSNTDKSTWPEYTKGTLLKTEIQKRVEAPGIKLSLKSDSGIPNKLVESLKQVGLAARNHPEGPFTVQVNDSYRPLARAIKYVCDKFKEVQKLKDEGKAPEAEKLWKTLGPVLSFPGANAHNIASGGAVDVLLLDNDGKPLVPNGWFNYDTQADPSKARAVRILAEIFYKVPGWQRYMWEIWHFDYNSTAPLRTNTCTKAIREGSQTCPS